MDEDELHHGRKLEVWPRRATPKKTEIAVDPADDAIKRLTPPTEFLWCRWCGGMRPHRLRGDFGTRTYCVACEEQGRAY